MGQHLRRRRRGLRRLDLHLVGHRPPLGRRVAPGTVPNGTIAGLGLVTWVVLGSWLFLGWRTVAVEAGAVPEVAVEAGAVEVEQIHVPADQGRSPSLGGLGGGQRPVALVGLRVALGLPDRGPEGRILVVAARTGPVGFLLDEVVRVLRYDPEVCIPEATRPAAT